jgi:hypothetical protein
MVPDAPPPHRHVSSQPIALSAATRMLETYLTNSETHPHLHPDALITPTGVTFSSHGGQKGGVVVHNLRRVVAGLRGEYLEPEATPEPEEDAAADSARGKKGKKGKKAEPVEIEWQDKSDYEREQGEIEVGDVGDRVHVVQEGGEEPTVEVTGEKRKEAGGKVDKDARKRAKKERDEQRKRDNEKKRAAENAE